MRVLYVCRRFPKYSETFISNEVEALLARGVDVRVAALSLPHLGDPAIARVRHLSDRVACLRTGEHLSAIQRVVRNGALRALVRRRALKWWVRCAWWTLCTRDGSHLRRLDDALRLTELKEARSADRIHAHFAHGPTTAAMIAADLLRVPFSFTAHARDLYELTPVRLLRAKAHRADFVAVVGDIHRRFLIDCGIPPERVVVVRNGVSPSIPERNGKVPADPPLVLSVARFVPKKGHDVLLDAIGRLVDSGVEVRARLIGGGPLHEDLLRRRDELGLGDRVAITGKRPWNEVAEELGAADIFALPCRVTASGDRDGLPVSVTEAMAAGLPVVSTAVSALPEAIDDGRDGLLVAPDDPDALAEQLGRLIADPRLQREIGFRAMERARTQFSLDRSAEQLAGLFARTR